MLWYLHSSFLSLTLEDKPFIGQSVSDKIQKLVQLMDSQFVVGKAIP